MQLSKRQINQLTRIVEIAQALLDEAAQEGPRRGGDARSKSRRSGAELAAFRKMIKADRKKGVPVAELARKHGVTPSYIYQI